MALKVRGKTVILTGGWPGSPLRVQFAPDTDGADDGTGLGEHNPLTLVERALAQVVIALGIERRIEEIRSTNSSAMCSRSICRLSP